MLLVEEGEGWGSSLAVCEILSKNRPLNRRRFEDMGETCQNGCRYEYLDLRGRNNC
jgi:hypothetical protein